jgi:hypothetical protein
LPAQTVSHIQNTGVIASNRRVSNLAGNHVTLRKLWSRHEPRRADGGWWSLSGFSIQATIALERFVRQALINNQADALGFEQ